MAEPPTSAGSYSSDEMMTVTAARCLQDGQVCFVGIGLPSEAANLARLSHAPDVVLVYESGTIGTRPEVLPLSIGDGELAETADLVVGVPEIFAYWLQAGRIDVGFLSAAQIDRFGNLNSTVIGPYDQPDVRLPGGGGAPEIAANAGEVIVMLRQTPRSFVAEIDFVTSIGFGRDGRGRAGARGAGPTVVITDMGVLKPDQVSRELTLVAVHPGVEVDAVRRATGWELRIADVVEVGDAPTREELGVLRDLKERTRLAHSG
ncbi:MAG TPA: CoA-transferase [Acidimicrobiia bacterium]|nr:CoA-transferase [Acidimicrobiia bacterium]